MESLRERYLPEMPPIDGGAYLVQYLLEIGPIAGEGMGIGAITHEAIRAWQDNLGVELAPWECRFLRRLSQEYVTESHRATKRDAPAPYEVPGEKPQVTDAQAALRALAKL